MKPLFAAACLLSVLACRAPVAREGYLVHHVTLTLSAPPPGEAAALLDACWALADVPGVVALEAGLPAKELATGDRPQDYTVALRVVFADQAAHDVYQTHPLHVALLERFGPQFAGAEVRDWWVTRQVR